MTDIVVIGFSGNALDAFDAITAQFTIRAFLDDNPTLSETAFQGIPILPISRLADFPEAFVICLIGSERSFAQRGAIIGSLGLPTERFATVIAPTATISSLATLGRGCLVMAGAVVTSNARIANHVMILPQSVIHHDVVIADHCIIGSHAIVAGSARMGDSCYIGSGSSIKNGLTIGSGSLIGMAANVIRSVPKHATMVGNPARVLRSN
jgi:sugar O-acyltransferase (sialic acid O-acetyltransferase NeuD family)